MKIIKKKSGSVDLKKENKFVKNFKVSINKVFVFGIFFFLLLIIQN